MEIEKIIYSRNPFLSPPKFVLFVRSFLLVVFRVAVGFSVAALSCCFSTPFCGLDVSALTSKSSILICVSFEKPVESSLETLLTSSFAGSLSSSAALCERENK